MKHMIGLSLLVGSTLGGLFMGGGRKKWPTTQDHEMMHKKLTHQPILKQNHEGHVDNCVIIQQSVLY